MRAIILAGGLGTRLRSVVNSVPKVMAPINDVPFLELLLRYLENSGFKEITLSVGYLSRQIIDYFGDRHGALNISYSVEDSPLGTGGAIRQALTQLSTGDVFVLNGDTFLKVDYRAMLKVHQKEQSDITIALRSVDDCSRYGKAKLSGNETGNEIVGFEEKSGAGGPGLINGGVYLIKTDIFANRILPETFSFEQNFLTECMDVKKLNGYVSDSFFIDIGVPEDYRRAQVELMTQI